MVYADGLLKFEPRDLKNIPLPRPHSVVDAEESYRKIAEFLVRGQEGRAEQAANRYCGVR
jgi:hypothetical protein